MIAENMLCVKTQFRRVQVGNRDLGPSGNRKLGLALTHVFRHTKDMTNTQATSQARDGRESGFGMAQALHLPQGATYTHYIHNDTAYWMLDAVRNEGHRRTA